MIKLIDLLREIRINNPKIPTNIPKGWTKVNNPWQDAKGGEIIAGFEAPMEGWDEEHKDYIWIYKSEDGKYIVGTNYAFSEYNDEAGIFDSPQKAFAFAIKEMKELKEDWDEEYLDEIKVNKPIHFPTNEDWVYIINNNQELENVIKILKSQNWINSSTYKSNDIGYPAFIKGYINKVNKKIYFISLTPDKDWGKILNPQKLDEIKINDPTNIITPQIIYDKYKKFDNIGYEKFIKILEDYGFVPEDGEDIRYFLKSLHQSELNKLYFELSQIQEIRINKPGKIQAIYQPDKESNFDQGHGKVYKLDLKRNDVVAIGDYLPSSDKMNFYISTWGAGLKLKEIFDKKGIKYSFKKDPFDEKYADIWINNASRYFEFNDSVSEIKINNPIPFTYEPKNGEHWGLLKCKFGNVQAEINNKGDYEVVIDQEVAEDTNLVNFLQKYDSYKRPQTYIIIIPKKYVVISK